MIIYKKSNIMKIVIYTAIVGNYDELRQPLSLDDRFEYVCFCNDFAENKIGVWEIRKFSVVIDHNQRLSRYPKIKPHEVLTDFDYSVYMDANLVIAESQFYDRIIDLIDQNTKLSGVKNGYRDCLYVEGFRCLLSKLDTLTNIVKEMRYIKNDGFPSHYGMYEANIIFRNHHDLDVIKQCDMWWIMVNKFAKRDQLCFSYTIWKCGLPWSYIFPDETNTHNNSNIIFYEHPYRVTLMRNNATLNLRKIARILKPFLFIVYKFVISFGTKVSLKFLLKKIRGFIFYDMRFILFKYKCKTAHYLERYYISSVEKNITNKSKRTIIYMMDGRAYSGGLSDILRGILSMYKIAKRLDYGFGINFTFPYKLTDYLVPNSYDWVISENEISYNRNYSKPLWFYSAYAANAKTQKYESDYQYRFLRKYLKNNNKMYQHHIYANCELIHGGEFSILYNELFKPSLLLQNEIDCHLKNIDCEYVSMTFRFQQLLGDFEDFNSEYVKDLRNIIQTVDSEKMTKNSEMQLRAILGDFKDKKISETLIMDERNKLMRKCIDKIKDIHRKYHSSQKILVTADSEVFLNEVSKLDFVYVLSQDNCEKKDRQNLYRFLKPFVDMLMISNAKKIYLLCTGPMYRSGFAKNASYINNVDYQEILF